MPFEIFIIPGIIAFLIGFGNGKKVRSVPKQMGDK